MRKLAERQQAKNIKSPRYFTGRPCKRGHIAERFTSTGICVACGRGYCREWRSIDTNREKNRAYSATYRLSEGYRPRYTELARKWRNKIKEKEAGRPRPPMCEATGEAGQVVFDHCHKTGAFRGWILDKYNTILGLADDRPDILRKLANYLEDAESAHPKS